MWYHVESCDISKIMIQKSNIENVFQKKSLKRNISINIQQIFLKKILYRSLGFGLLYESTIIKFESLVIEILTFYFYVLFLENNS
jgi:hypothetical protein